jgi:hypothetical protein
MKKKIMIGLIVCMLTFMPVLSMTAVADSGPRLEIVMKCGLGINTAIKNTGDAIADTVSQEMFVKGGIVRKDFCVHYAIGNIDPGVQKSVIVFGRQGICGLPRFGAIDITINTSAKNAEPVTTTVHAFALGWIVIVAN